MNIAAFAAGYRVGHDGHPPLLPALAIEHQLEDVEAHPLRPLGPDNDDDWAWHLIGWTVGQAVAVHQMGRP
jgi:hypothetical protein